jgi:hypothetical protein
MKSKNLLVLLAVAASCGPNDVRLVDAPDDEDALDQAFTSARATQLDFTMSLSLESTGSVWSARSLIDAQMLYTMGHLNGVNGVGRLDKVAITNVATETLPSGKSSVTYTVKLPVAWGSKTNLPTSYNFILPRLADASGLNAFSEKYSHTCVDSGAHDVDSGNYWYYYRPQSRGCTFADEDVVRVTAQVAVSTENTTGRYPEYDKVWEDGVLNVVAVFGKYEDGATSDADAGIAAFNAFVRAVRMAFASMNVVSVPATVPASPGVATPDVSFTATLPNGRIIVVTALLVDNVRTTSAAFNARYEALSTRADLIAYNGHAGLGSNVRALARKGKWVAGQYAVFLMNGCDTFAYVDGSMAQTRAAINTDDPTGTKYMEIVTNAMPAYFHEMTDTTMALLKGLMAYEKPQTYQQMFEAVDPAQVIVVTGEEDNVFVPGGTPPPAGWVGLKENAVLTMGQLARFVTPTLKAGKYEFTMTGSGDAGLFIRAGLAPTTRTYDCRSNVKNSSNETCTLTLLAAAPIHVMARGYTGPTATIQIIGKQLP